MCKSKQIVYNGFYGKTTQRIRAQAKIKFTQDQKTVGAQTRDAVCKKKALKGLK